MIVLWKICLVLMLPTFDVYQKYPVESWLKVKLGKHGPFYLSSFLVSTATLDLVKRELDQRDPAIGLATHRLL